MRSCCAVYVDVGYLLAAAATRVTGSSLRRGVQADFAALIEALISQATADSGLPLLRVNWYDAGARPGGRPDLTQDQVGLLPNVKLRLGRLSYTGDQKGVDVRIGLDLAIQARNRVADVIYLVSGDDDLTEAVEEAQSHGVQIVLLAVPRHDGQPLAVAKHLLREVDRALLIDGAAIDAAVRPTAIPESLIPGSGEEARPADGAPEPPEATPRQVGPPRPGPRPPVVPADPAKPSPSLLAQRRAVRVALPESPLPVPAHGGEMTLAVIDAVAQQVVATWAASATPETLASLRGEAPLIPADLDRALLVDLSSQDAGDVDEAARRQIRDRFWYHVGRLRLV